MTLLIGSGKGLSMFYCGDATRRTDMDGSKPSEKGNVGLNPLLFHSQADTALLETIRPRVTGFRTILANTYIISERDGGWILVDAGVPGFFEQILAWVRTHRYGSRPHAIVLTHGHFDHVGNIEEMIEHWKVPVYAHELEIPYLAGKSRYTAPDLSAQLGVMTSMANLIPKEPVNIEGRVSPLPADGGIPGLTSWRWVHTPGHTPGHVSLFREEDRTLVAGDAIATTEQASVAEMMQQKAKLSGPPVFFQNDWHRTGQSMRKLATLKPHAIASGHGRPFLGQNVVLSLKELALEFSHRR